MKKQQKSMLALAMITAFITAGLLLPAIVDAGDLEPTAGPDDSGSAMYTIEDIYNYLDTGVAGVKRSSGFTEPTSEPGSTMHTLDEIMNKAPAPDNVNGVTPGEVLSSKTYWGLRTDGTWGPQTGTAESTSSCTGDAATGDVLSGKTFSNATSTGLTGTMPDNEAVTYTPGTADQTVAAGYHNGLGKVLGDADLASGNIKSGVSIFGVAGTSVQASGAATDAQVLTGVTYSNASGASTGTMTNVGQQNITPGTISQTITLGYHDGTGQVAGDANLAPGNIKSGVSIFGVAGDSNVVDTSSGDAVSSDILSGKKAWVDGSEVTGTGALAALPAPVAKTGQTGCWDTEGNSLDCAGTGQDGELRKGVSWPNPRFTDNGDGTVTDNLTGLIWLKNANCFGANNWSGALSNCNNLESGACGLTDGSTAGDWRLPNVKEFFSLVHFGFDGPALPNTAGTGQWTADNPFTMVMSDWPYWSSSTKAGSTFVAWSMQISDGWIRYAGKTSPYYTWPVRGGN